MSGVVSAVFGVLLCVASVFTYRRRASPATGRAMRSGAASSGLSGGRRPFSPARAGFTAVAGFLVGVLCVVYGLATL